MMKVDYSSEYNEVVALVLIAVLSFFFRCFVLFIYLFIRSFHIDFSFQWS
jgi:hypothetical protein